MKISIDGRIVEGRDAAIPVLDHGFLYGDGVFEGIRIYARRVFRLDDHLRRLGISAAAIGLGIPGGLENVRRIVLDTASAADLDEAYVRLVLTRGDGPLGVDPTLCAQPRIVCIVDELRMFAGEDGVSLVTVSLRRPPADVLDPRVKSLNYLNNVLAKAEARSRGADDALVLNLAGAVSEASGANVFVVRAGALATPPATDGALEGIVRDTVLGLAAKLSIPARERTLGRIDLLGADEVFLTGTGARLVPVRSLDGRPIGAGAPGPVTVALRDAFLEHARETGVAVPPRQPVPFAV